ncbi:MAG: altronate dehydratase [Lachnospiraceae bacterium]|nr:altronate dehydratase [Lachnospiraceae bacterium]
MSLLQIHQADNVAVDTDTGHKKAICDIPAGSDVIKYGFPIGYATADIAAGEHVHTHNMATKLKDKLEYKYTPIEKAGEMKPENEYVRSIMAYVRKNGEIGVRNDIWIINTVGCVNKLAEKLAGITGALAFPHPYGCSQLGGDHATTQKILKGLVKHPNAGGVLVLGLGCENNNIEEFKKVLGPVDEERVRFLNAQSCEDEIKEGVSLIRELQEIAAGDQRVPVPVSKLKVGLKCGGSDGFSGITANPLIGQFSDWLCANGGSTVLTEVPEMFGAEHLLMNRCADREVFDKTVALINDFKDYFTRHDQVIYENPSPGNKEGGITTLEEKSLGCTQKGGTSEVTDVLDYGDIVVKSGLNLLNGPGNDMVAVTNLTAAGCHMILFSTGRGTPLGAPVPTIKVGTNCGISYRKKNWIDFDAGPMIDGIVLKENFIDYCIQVAEGTLTKNEENGYREIAIFKDGVTL